MKYQNKISSLFIILILFITAVSAADMTGLVYPQYRGNITSTETISEAYGINRWYFEDSFLDIFNLPLYNYLNGSSTFNAISDQEITINNFNLNDGLMFNGSSESVAGDEGQATIIDIMEIIGSTSHLRGYNITPAQEVNIISIEKYTTSDSISALIIETDGTVLVNKTYSGDIAEFVTPITLTQDTSYYIVNFEPGTNSYARNDTHISFPYYTNDLNIENTIALSATDYSNVVVTSTAFADEIVSINYSNQTSTTPGGNLTINSTYGKYGKGAFFNGNTSRITIEDDASLTTNAEATLMLWINPLNLTTENQTLVYRNNSYDVRIHEDDLQVHWKADDSTIITHEVVNVITTTDQWYHLAATYSESDGFSRLYLDGVNIDNQSVTTGLDDGVGYDIFLSYNSSSGSGETVYTNSVLNGTGLLNYYKFDDNLLDSHGSVDGTGINGTSYAAGVINNGVDLENNSQQWVNLTKDMLGAYETGTIAMWIKPESLHPVDYSSTLFSASSGYSAAPEWRIDISQTNPISGELANGLKYVYRNNAGGDLTMWSGGNTTFVAGQTYLVTIASDNTNITVYVNGNEELFYNYGGGATMNGDWFADIGTADLLYNIGVLDEKGHAKGVRNYFDGIIDEVSIWDYALNSTQIALLNNSGSGMTYEAITASTTTSSNVTNHFNGSLDEFRLWNKTLNHSEIIAEMNSPLPLVGEDLLLSYSFEDYNTTHVRDSHYLVGRTNSTGSLVSPAYNFDGIDDYLSIPKINLTKGRFSVSWWSKQYCPNGNENNCLDPHGNRGILTKSTSYPEPSIYQYYKRDITLYDDDGFAHRFLSSNFHWNVLNHFVVFSEDYNSTHARLRLFQNGVEIVEDAFHTGNFTNMDSIGYWPSVATYGTYGFISDIQIFNRSLSEEQIAILYQEQANGYNGTSRINYQFFTDDTLLTGVVWESNNFSWSNTKNSTETQIIPVNFTTDNITWSFTDVSSLSISNMSVGYNWTKINNDNITFVPNASTNISINSWTDSSNSFTTSDQPLTIPFIIRRGSTLAYIRSLSTDYYSAFTPTTEQAFSYFFSGNMTIYFYWTNTTPIDVYQKNVTIVSNLSSVPYTTTATSLNITQLVPNEYEVRVYTNGTNPSHKFITVNAESTSTINFYLELNTTSTEEQLFQVVDTSGNNIEGAIIRVQKELDNTTGVYKTVDEAITGAGGKTYIWLEKERDVYYRFAVINNDVMATLSPSGETYTTKQSFISGVDETVQLIIETASGSAGDPLEEVSSVSASCEWDTNILIITCDWSDALNLISGARLEVWGQYIDSNLSLINIYSNTSTDFTGSLSYTFTPINNTYFEARFYTLRSTHDVLEDVKPKTFDMSTKGDKNFGLLISALIVVLVAFLTIKWSALVSSVLAFLTLSFSKAVGFIDFPTAIITSIIALAIIIFVDTIKRRQGRGT